MPQINQPEFTSMDVVKTESTQNATNEETETPLRLRGGACVEYLSSHEHKMLTSRACLCAAGCGCIIM